MGEYIYRRTSRSSVVELPTGEEVLAVHLVYAYKPYINFNGEKENSKMARTAMLHVTNADRVWKKRGVDPNGFKYAVLEHNGSITGGSILKFNGVPGLTRDSWRAETYVGMVPELRLGRKEKVSA